MTRSAQARRPAGGTETVLIVGATSTVGRAVAREYARRGFALVLAGRDRRELDVLAADLNVRYAVSAEPLELDALDFASHERVVREAIALCPGRLAGAAVFLGYLGDEELARRDPSESRRIVDTNLTGCMSLLNPLANHLEEQRGGFICALSSVAGDRGRQSNYLYGAAKAGLTAYLQGLRNRLFAANVRVVTVKPGFMDTAMTYGKPGMFLVAAPEAVAPRIVDASLGGPDVVYLPGFWRWIMLAIRSIPEPLFKRLRL